LGITLRRNPNGAVNEISRSVKEAAAKRAARKARGAAGTGAEDDLDRLGLDAPFTEDDLRLLDHELGLDEVEGYAELIRVPEPR
ncbi:MAG TPA: hypothetical protein PKA98_08585, partial [Acidimicrobiales bacterium]|nr:hypothetical protein [Acidimicrobiales bacterium]